MPQRLLRVLALLKDPRVSKLPRIAVLLAVAYLLWPLDLLPDFIAPVIGYLDDLTLVWIALRWLVRSDPGPVISVETPAIPQLPPGPPEA